MEMQRVWAVYFSGTGTTEKVVTRMAKIAAEDLGAEYKTFCFNLPKDREGELSFGPGDLVIFGTPVYAGRVPNLLLPYIRDKVKGNGALAVPVSLFGNRNFDDGLIELRNVLEFSAYLTPSGVIDREALPNDLTRIRETAGLTLAQRTSAFERRVILNLLERNGSSLEGKKKTAAQLGISLASLYNKLSANRS